jgi:hypothetical protein
MLWVGMCFGGSASGIGGRAADLECPGRARARAKRENGRKKAENLLGKKPIRLEKLH